MALGVSTCPSPDPMDANIERKLHDANTPMLHTNEAVTKGMVRSSERYFLFREATECFVRRADELSDFI